MESFTVNVNLYVVKFSQTDSHGCFSQTDLGWNSAHKSQESVVHFWDHISSKAFN